MKISDLFIDVPFDVNANVKIFAGGPWNDGGEQVGSFSCGKPSLRSEKVLDSNITYMTTDEKGCIIIECDMKLVEFVRKLEISKMLTASTTHVTESTMIMLEQDDERNEIGLPVYSKKASNDSENYGLFIYLTGIEQANIPEDLMPLIKLAEKNECSILCLDSDGPEIVGLPIYDW